MKIKVKDLKPNPYRNFKRFPIDKDKVETLKGSIQETGFWDNLIARKNGEGYELAYGHHRLAAIKEIGIEEIDIPVKDISDSMMLKIMANENMEFWGQNTSVIIETVLSVKEYLDSELAKYDSWEELPDCLMNLLDSERNQDKKTQFGNLKTKGVGQTTILKFLGKGWTQWRIQSALAAIKDEKMNIESLKIFESQNQAEEFRRAIKKKNIDLNEQIELAKKVKKHFNETKGESGQKSQRNTINTIIKQETDGVDEFTAILSELEDNIGSITIDVKSLKNKILLFNGKLHEMDIESIKPLASLFAIQEFTELLHGIKVLSEYFGVQFKNQLK